ncbi:MAG: hypothetical protein ACI8ZN_000469 [Bacteroidia bacterium]|jgi:hypothetical protein
MKKIERVLIVPFLIGIVLYLFNLPGGSFIVVLSLGLLSMFYFSCSVPLFNEDPLKSASVMNIGVCIGIGLSLSTLIMGILFKLMMWKSDFELLLSGVVGLAISMTAAIYWIKKDNNVIFKRLAKRVIPFGILGLTLFLLPQKSLYNWHFSDHPEYLDARLKLDQNPNDTTSLRIVDEFEKEMLERERKKEEESKAK